MIRSSPRAWLEHALEFLPVCDVETGCSRSRGASGRRGRSADPGVEIGVEVRVGDDRLAPEAARPAARQQDAEPIDLEAVLPVEGVADDLFVLPAHQQKGGVAVEEVMLAGALPDEVPGVILVDAQDAATAGGRLELAGMVRMTSPWRKDNRVGVGARLRGHEADAIGAAVGRVAEALDGRRLAALTLELAADRDVREGVLRG